MGFKKGFGGVLLWDKYLNLPQMKTLFYLYVFLFIGNYCYSQDVEELPAQPWEELVEMNNHEYSKISKWNKDVYVELIGNYNKQDSLEVDRIIKKYNLITETITIKFATDNNANFKIKFLNKYVYDKYDSSRKINDQIFTDQKRNYKKVELYLYLVDKTNSEIRKSLESSIVDRLVAGAFPYSISRTKRNSIFNSYTDKKNITKPLNSEDLAIIKEVYKKGFEKRLQKAEQQFSYVLKNIENSKIKNRDRNLWWVRNPISVIILPALIFILFSIYVLSKVNNILVRKINKSWLRFLIFILAIIFFVDVLIIFFVSTFDFLTIPDNYRKIPFVREDTILTTIMVSLFSMPVLLLIRSIELKIQEKVNSILQKTALIFISTGFSPFLLICLFYLGISSGESNMQGGYATLANIFVCLMIVAVLRALISYFIFKERNLIIENEKKLSNLRELKAKAELKSLQSQINPHFLYNSLNSIASLAPIDSVKTQKMAHSLSDLFKYSINRKGKKMSTVKDEIEMVTSYLSIEKIRFGDRLQFDIEVDKSLENYEIPLFLIQPLVENAVKHGISQNEGNGQIILKIEKLTDELVISVKDNGPNFPEGLVSGHGLQTVYDLLRLSYGDKASLNWTNTPEKIISITIAEIV